jgi:hypothetical protein
MVLIRFLLIVMLTLSATFSVAMEAGHAANFDSEHTVAKTMSDYIFLRVVMTAPSAGKPVTSCLPCCRAQKVTARGQSLVKMSLRQPVFC